MVTAHCACKENGRLYKVLRGLQEAKQYTIKPDVYSLHRLGAALDLLHGSYYFTNLDLLRILAKVTSRTGR